MKSQSQAELRQAAIAAAQASVYALDEDYCHEARADFHETASLAHRAAGDIEAAELHDRAAIAQRFVCFFPTDEALDISFDASLAAHVVSDTANSVDAHGREWAAASAAPRTKH
jgi:hypothetical protein|tara:strand:+ start:1035 stop:1376 length:342 start_codon:yes stop_codon:yes gene_type:complete